MSESYLGEIRMFAGNFAPQGWALCNGQLLSIAENEALFALIGTTYGGDGQTTFALPDLQGRIAVHPNSSLPRGSKAGTETVTLTLNQLAPHTHVPNAISAFGQGDSPSNSVWAQTSYSNYTNPTGNTLVGMNAAALSPVGGNQPHDNMMPTTVISFIISLYGLFPPQP
ncbi:phage tail protein [Paenibacillus nanensis]|uniref:Phage tail protein n=1 Tax=Paenibacillus nanensis TaxID=393251 RepID=A0A3A1UU63_9BACL|nr:tail fiber protein [Paenibacillus nanensis]RIX50712.1 phage tail protein [Paenibacillus nanensis]